MRIACPQCRFPSAATLCALAVLFATAHNEAWAQRVIDPDCGEAFGICAADLDNDGDLDVAAASRLLRSILWWENDGALNFTRHSIAAGFEGGRGLCAADLDGDGDQDLIAGDLYSSGPFFVAWWENQGAGQFARHDLDNTYAELRAIVTADLDGDGDPDFATAGSNGLAWWKNDGSGAFQRTEMTAERTDDVAAIDREGDGDVDLVTVNPGAWWINDGGGVFTPDWFTWETAGSGEICAADVNGDGEAEAVIGAYGLDSIGWLQRVGNEYRQHEIAPYLDRVYDVWAGDLDCDGDSDVAGVSSTSGIRWYENSGQGVFREHVVSPNGEVRCVEGVDMDRDGDTELVTGASGVTYWPNQWKAPGPAPILQSVSDGGGGALALQWFNTNDVPMQFLGIAYDIYALQWAPNGWDGSPWHAFSDTLSAGRMTLGESGGYHVWICSQFPFNEVLFSPNPWTGILYDASPHWPRDFQATLSDGADGPFGPWVDLRWRSDVYGTWLYEFIAYNLDEGWVETYSPLDGQAFWHLAAYPSASHLNGQASLSLPPGNYWMYLRAAGWVPPYPTGPFALAFVSVPGM